MLFSRKPFAALLAVAAVRVQAGPDWVTYDIGAVYCGPDKCVERVLSLNHCVPFDRGYIGQQLEEFKLDRCDSYCLFYENEDCTGRSDGAYFPGRSDLKILPYNANSYICNLHPMNLV